MAGSSGVYRGVDRDVGLTLTVFRWKNPAVMPLYYTIEKKEDSQSAEWEPLTDHKIDPEEASYLSQYLDIFTLNLENSPGKLLK